MRKVLQQLGQYKRDTFLCIGLTALEVIMEILMPFVTSIIIDRGLEAGNLSVVYRYGALMVVMAFLIVVCVVVVSNTIKLTVFARAREIRIMKYVGATNWFIRGPFMAEGIIIGIIAALAAAGLMTLLYSNVVNIIGTQVIAIVSSPLISVGYLAGNMLVIFLALGVSIGAWGSIVSMRKFLDT